MNANKVGGVSRIGTIKYGLESRGTLIRELLHWRDPEALVKVNYNPIFSSERVPPHQEPSIVRQKKNLVTDHRS
jgi:hypothetical protein